VGITVPSWAPGRTFYHVHSHGVGGGLAAVTRYLDHIVGLGCGGVLLTPIHAAATHGYDTIDAFSVDARLGDDSAFAALVEGCHARDLRLVLDGVFNHVGRDFPRPDWLSGRGWEGHDELRELDHSNPEVLEWSIAVARHWLDRGADGWRFDVAYTIPTSFLRAMTDAVRATHPEALLVGEMIHGDLARFAGDAGLHGMTQYELYKAIWSSLNDRNCWELAHALERHQVYCETSVPFTFVGNHDVTRVRTQVADDRLLEHALAVLFTVPGIPSAYYGDELGFTGAKEDRAGGDDAVRQPLPDAPGDVDERFSRWIAFRRAHPELTSAPLQVLSKTNHTITYRVGAIEVSLDLEAGVTISGL
jgi:cyclomaltodextrinase / maltogenic alpha-amylase / neopullulanase